MLYMHIAPFHSQPGKSATASEVHVLVKDNDILRVENEKGLCAYIVYIHIAPFHSQADIHQ